MDGLSATGWPDVGATAIHQQYWVPDVGWQGPICSSNRLMLGVAQPKRGVVQGSATLSMAYAGALFADACLRALNGEPNVSEYAYVESDVIPGVPFFSSKVLLNPEGLPLVYTCFGVLCNGWRPMQAGKCRPTWSAGSVSPDMS